MSCLKYYKNKQAKEPYSCDFFFYMCLNKCLGIDCSHLVENIPNKRTLFKIYYLF